MRSEAQELRLPSPRRSTSARRATDVGPVEALDEAFAHADAGDWRHDDSHARSADDLAVAVRSQLAALAEQSRELTRLLGRLESGRRG